MLPHIINGNHARSFRVGMNIATITDIIKENKKLWKDADVAICHNSVFISFGPSGLIPGATMVMTKVLTSTDVVYYGPIDGWMNPALPFASSAKFQEQAYQLISEKNKEDKKWCVYFLDGELEVITGSTIAIAFKNAGYGAAATAAVDFYAEGDTPTHTWHKGNKEWELKHQGELWKASDAIKAKGK